MYTQRCFQNAMLHEIWRNCYLCVWCSLCVSCRNHVYRLHASNITKVSRCILYTPRRVNDMDLATSNWSMHAQLTCRPEYAHFHRLNVQLYTAYVIYAIFGQTDKGYTVNIHVVIQIVESRHACDEQPAVSKLSTVSLWHSWCHKLTSIVMCWGKGCLIGSKTCWKWFSRVMWRQTREIKSDVTVLSDDRRLPTTWREVNLAVQAL